MTKNQTSPFEYEASQIRKLAADRTTVWSYGDYILRSGLTHAQEEFVKDGITEPDVRYVLKSGIVTNAEIKNDGCRYMVEGKNVDGISMVFIVIFSVEDKKLHIRTGWTR